MSNPFEFRNAYAVSPYGEGYAFVNNKHEQFGSTSAFNGSKTSQLSDPKPTAQMRVKSGYTGHVPKGRDHIGSTYRMHDNRGTAGKTMVPIPHHNIDPPNDEYLAKMKRNLTYFSGQSAVFQGRMTGGSGISFDDSTAGPSTVKVPDRTFGAGTGNKRFNSIRGSDFLDMLSNFITQFRRKIKILCKIHFFVKTRGYVLHL